MKRLFLSILSLVPIGLAPFAQEAIWSTQESLEALGLSSDYTELPELSVLAEGEHGTFVNAFTDNVKIMDISTNNVKSVVVDGVEYQLTKGITGSTNTSVSISTPPSGGWAFQIEIEEDGWVTLFGKFSSNKAYYVFEGDATTGMLCNYDFGMIVDLAEGEKFYEYSLPGDDELGYFSMDLPDADKYSDGTDLRWAEKIILGEDAADMKKNGFGYISFPVYKEAGVYLVCGQRTKIISNGFIFTHERPRQIVGMVPEKTDADTGEVITCEAQWVFRGSSFERQEAYTEVGLLYEYTDATHTAYKVSGHTSDLPAEVVIPPTHEGLPVTSIGDWAFSSCRDLNSVTIPESVTSIGDCAFYGCSSLTSVTIPESVTYIGRSVFNCCTGLTSVTIPESVTTIGDWAFEYCSGLTSVTIPESVTSIGDRAFGYCSGLTSVTIPESVTSIGVNPFNSCDNLNAFYGKFASSDNRCLVKDGCLISFAPSGLNEYTILESVTSIRGSAFSGSRGLTAVTIPQSVTYIDGNPFISCDNLSTFNGKFVSSDNRSLIQNGYLKSFAPAGLTEYAIPETVTHIGYEAFEGCKALTSVYIPELVTSIGEEAFMLCRGLTSVNIPESVTYIGSYAFDDCYSLTSVTMPKSVSYIGNYAFYGLTNLQEVYATGITPYSISSYVFSSTPIENCTLYVPKGSREAYAAAEVWRDFGNIVEVEDSYSLEVAEIEVIAEQVALIPVSLTNEGGVKGLQCDIHLPAGVEMATDDYGYAYIERSDRTSIHDFGINYTNGCWRIVCTNMRNIEIPAGDGVLFYIPVIAEDNPADLTLSIDNIYLSLTGDVLQPVAPTEGTLHILPAFIIGDADGDRAVTVADFTYAVSYILGHEVEGFNFRAADINGDGQVLISDATAILSLVLESGQGGGAASSLPAKVAKAPATTATGTFAMTPLVCKSGEKAELSITFANSEAIRDFQMSFTLPAGITVDSNSYGYYGTPTGRASRHTCNIVCNNGVYTTTVTSLNGYEIAAGEGVVLTIPITVEAAAGEYSVPFSNVIYSKPSRVDSPDFTGTITVGTVDAGDYALTFEDATVAGSKVVNIPVRMTNAKTAIAFGCRITLPAGLEIVKDDNDLYAFAKGERMTTAHLLASGDDNGTVKVLGYSMSNAPYRDSDGVFFYIPVRLTNPDMDPGTELTLSVTEILITNTDFNEYECPDASATVTVGVPYTPGDVNDDGRITPLDITLVVSKYLGGNPGNFNMQAADMNQDSRLTPLDVSLLVSHYLGGSSRAPQHYADIPSSGEYASVSIPGDGTLVAGLSGIHRFTAAQIDVEVPFGVSIENVALTVESNHVVRFVALDESKYRVLVYSPANENLPADAALRMFLSGTGSGVIAIDNILATERCSADEFEEYTVDSDSLVTTGLDLGVADSFRIVPTAEGVTITSPCDTTITLCDTLGRARTFEIKAGVNTISLEKGVYLLGAQKIVVR